VNRELVFGAVAEERRQIACLLDGFDAQLATPSLCAGWDVKTVAAHIVSTVTDGTSAFLRLAVRRGSMGNSQSGRLRSVIDAANHLGEFTFDLVRNTVARRLPRLNPLRYKPSSCACAGLVSRCTAALHPCR
jgi:uncharacterized protein (TIGR03083 family)